MNNEEYLKQLADAQKQQKQVELEQQKAAALKSIEQEQAVTMPTYTTQKQQASVQSQLGAKNLAEFWANRGQTQAGISQQAELSRQNTLAGSLGTIATNEQSALQNFASQKGTAETNYQSGLTSASNEIDTNLATNLYNEKVRQQQIAEAERIRLANIKAEKQMAAYKAYLENKQSTTPADGTVEVVNGVVYTWVNGKKTKQTYEKDAITGETKNKKLEKWNKSGYGLTNYDSGIKYKDNQNYKLWTKDGNYYLIAGKNQDTDVPILVSGDQNTVYQSINNAVKTGAITTAKADEIYDAIFPSSKQPANYYDNKSLLK